MIDFASALEQALQMLDRFGVLLFSDPALPSLVSVIVGEPLRKSWWGHERGDVIYQTMNAMEDRPDVLTAKLVAGKVTYVHRRLWPSVYRVGIARQRWQMEDISPGAQWLLGLVDTDGEVQTHDLPPLPATLGWKRKRVPDSARELERRLLVHATEVHTPSGAHAKVLQTWQRWAEGIKLPPPSLSASDAQRELEQAAQALAAQTPGGVARLPWQ